MRRCPFRGCGVTLNNKRPFACAEHYMRLSAKQKTTVWNAHDDWMNGKIDARERDRIFNRVLVDLQGLFATGGDDASE